MILLHRLYIKEFIMLLLIVVLGLTVVTSMYESMDKLGDFKPYDPEASQLLMYWVYTLPRYVLYLLPMGILVSGMFVVGHASRSRELVAYMAAGGRIRHLMRPFIIIGALLSIFAFFASEIVVPASSRKVIEVEESIISRKKVSSRRVAGVTWLRADDGSIVRVRLYVPSRDFFKDFSVFTTDDERLTRIITASRARYLPESGVWELNAVKDYYPATGEMSFLKTMKWSQLGSPGVFSGRMKKPYEMTFLELRDYAQRLRDTGFVNLRLNVEMHSKISYPFINLIVMVLGISFAAKRNMGGLFAASFSLLFTLAYWFGYTILLAMGFAGIIPPLLAVWIMPIAFGFVSAWFFYQVPE